MDSKHASPEDGPDKRLRFFTSWCVAVIVIGFGLLGFGVITEITTAWNIALVAPGASLVVASTAAFAAVKSVVTWGEQRKRDRDAAEYRHREETYGEIIDHMIAAFLAEKVQSDVAGQAAAAHDRLRHDAKLRAKAGLWAKTSTIESLARWREAIAPVNQQNGVVGEHKEAIMEAFYNVVIAMRSDLSRDGAHDLPTKDFLLRSIFDDRPPLPVVASS